MPVWVCITYHMHSCSVSGACHLSIIKGNLIFTYFAYLLA